MKEYLLNLLIIIISIWLAFMISVHSDKKRDRNDLYMYQKYYECINHSSDCKDIIGNPSDVLFSWIVSISKIFIEKYYIFLFLYAFFINYLILWNIYKLSPFPLISVLFLLTDFRFYEYSSNILRVGLAELLLLIIFKWQIIHFNNNKYLVYKIIPLLAHISTFPALMAPMKRIKISFMLSSLIIIFILIFYFSHIFSFIKFFLPESILGKYFYYYNLTLIHSSSYSLPLHYISIIFLSIFLLNKIKSTIYIYAFNIVWFLFIFSFILHLLNLEYRMFDLMPPFLSILLAYHIKYFFTKIKSFYLKVDIIIIIVLLFVLIGFKNIAQILNGIV